MLGLVYSLLQHFVQHTRQFSDVFQSEKSIVAKWSVGVGKVLIFCAFALFPVHTFAQAFPDQRTIDSLSASLKEGDTFLPDSTKLLLYLDLAKQNYHREAHTSLRYSKIALEYAQKLKDSRRQAEALHQIAFIQEYLSQHSEALHNEMQALELYKNIQDSLKIAKTVGYLGRIFLYTGNYPKSLEYSFQAVSLLEQLHEKKHMASPLDGIGHVYYHQGDYAKALEYKFRALHLSEEVGDSDRISVVAHNIGRVYFAEKNYPLALQYYERSQRIDEQVRDSVGLGISYMTMAEICGFVGQSERGKELARRAIVLCGKYQDTSSLAHSFTNLASLQKNLREYDSAMVNARRGEKYALACQDFRALQKAYRTMSEIAEEQGNMSLALNYHKQLLQLRDSIYSDENKQKMAQVQHDYEVSRREQEITLLNKERAAQRTIEILLVGIAFVLVAALVLALNRYSVQKKSEEKIRDQNRMLLQREQDILAADENLRKANMELQFNIERLQQLNDEKNDLMGIVAHDLKNPLSAIRITAEYLLETAQIHDIPSKHRELYDDIIHSANKMFALITDILSVNMLEQGGLQLEQIIMSPQEIVAPLLAEHLRHAESKQIIILHVQPAPNLYFYVNPQAMMQVCENILSNAIKYSPLGKRIWIEIEECPDNPAMVRFAVRDEGPGISKEDQAKLFRKFTRLAARPTAGEHSTGLGLSIVKMMVDAMHGRVFCESESGMGTRFVIDVPRAKRSNELQLMD